MFHLCKPVLVKPGMFKLIQPPIMQPFVLLRPLLCAFSWKIRIMVCWVYTKVPSAKKNPGEKTIFEVIFTIYYYFTD